MSQSLAVVSFASPPVIYATYVNEINQSDACVRIVNFTCALTKKEEKRREEKRLNSRRVSLNSYTTGRGSFPLSEIHYVSFAAIIVHHHVVLPFSRLKHFMTC